MTEFITMFLKNLGCSHCQEFEFQENYNHENFKSWKLYIKEYEMYSAMILYNDILKKDISYLIPKNDCILLYNQKNELFIKLEYIARSDDNQYSILVATDEYQELYETFQELNKVFDPQMDAYCIGTFCVKKCK